MGRKAALGIVWLAVTAAAGCTIYHHPPPVAVTEEALTGECRDLGTVAETADMGSWQAHPKYADAARRRVLNRAAAIGATHVVWHYDYPQGAAAQAYRCPP